VLHVADAGLAINAKQCCTAVLYVAVSVYTTVGQVYRSCRVCTKFTIHSRLATGVFTTVLVFLSR
jgi:hypothetical protein